MPEPLHSEFIEDPDMADLIELFLDDLPDRITEMQQAVTSGNLKALAQTAHQLKGAGGGYGYPTITLQARTLEEQARTGQDLDAIREAVDQLTETCRAAMEAR